MKTIKEYEEEFDKKINSYFEEVPTFQMELVEVTKDFYRQAIKEILVEVVGEEDGFITGDCTVFNFTKPNGKKLKIKVIKQ
jgi:hypothetical protein